MTKVIRILSISHIDLHKTDENDVIIPRLKFLWFFKCELTKGRSISDFSWNKQNEDILAVAYGQSHSQIRASPGLILVWSAKNPEVGLKSYI
jgi:hypothetical protein